MTIDDVLVGDFTKQVSIMMPITSRDADTGEQITNFLTSSTVWANMGYRFGDSGEFERSGRKTEMTKVIFSMNYNSLVKPTWRIKYKSREFQIESIKESQNKMFMSVEAVSIKSWRNLYYVSPSSGFWTDPFGNYWVAVNRGADQPIFGNLTWTDGEGNYWTTE